MGTKIDPFLKKSAPAASKPAKKDAPATKPATVLTETITGSKGMFHTSFDPKIAGGEHDLTGTENTIDLTANTPRNFNIDLNQYGTDMSPLKSLTIIDGDKKNYFNLQLNSHQHAIFNQGKTELKIADDKSPDKPIVTITNISDPAMIHYEIPVASAK